jgi:fructose-specific phosphotransferase system component IIB
MPNSEATKIAVLQEHQLQMTNDITDIKNALKSQDVKLEQIKTLIATNLVNQTEFQSYKNMIETDLRLAKENSDKAISEAKKYSLLRTIGYCIITTVITCLVIFFFENK